MKKKVGILSMQRIFNYGSFLQAYALKSILEELDYEVEFVDYHPGECLIPPSGGTGIFRKVSKVIEILKSKAPFLEKIHFIKYKKNYAKNYYPYLGITKEMNYSPQVDILVIGSDEVFNCIQDNTNVGFSPELFGQGYQISKLVSYAASFGNTTEQMLKEYHVRGEVAKWLREFNAISVRDLNSKKIVESLVGKTPEYNLDPVLIYDFIGKCKQIPSTVRESKYIILYGYSGRFTKNECIEIRKYANTRNLKIFCIGGVQECCDKFIDCSPFEVIAYFQHADCIITDTFHGTIMSIITHKNFVSFVRINGYGNFEKLTDLLSRLQLENRIIKTIDEMSKVLEMAINYDNTDLVIRNERKKTYEYLEVISYF